LVEEEERRRYSITSTWSNFRHLREEGEGLEVVEAPPAVEGKKGREGEEEGEGARRGELPLI